MKKIFLYCSLPLLYIVSCFALYSCSQNEEFINEQDKQSRIEQELDEYCLKFHNSKYKAESRKIPGWALKRIKKALKSACHAVITDVATYEATNDLPTSAESSWNAFKWYFKTNTDSEPIDIKYKNVCNAQYYQTLTSIIGNPNCHPSERMGAQHNLLIIESLYPVSSYNSLPIDSVAISFSIGEAAKKFSIPDNRDYKLLDIIDNNLQDNAHDIKASYDIIFPDIKTSLMFLEIYLADMECLESINDLHEFSDGYRDTIESFTDDIIERKLFEAVTYYAEKCVELWYKIQINESELNIENEE